MNETTIDKQSANKGNTYRTKERQNTNKRQTERTQQKA